MSVCLCVCGLEGVGAMMMNALTVVLFGHGVLVWAARRAEVSGCGCAGMSVECVCACGACACLQLSSCPFLCLCPSLSDFLLSLPQRTAAPFEYDNNPVFPFDWKSTYSGLQNGTY
jgi:hypothetical protein